MARQQNPMRQSWLGEDQTEGWIAHRLILLVSPAWRRRPVPLIRLLERLEIEHLRHGGKENGRLHVAFDQFERFGVSRRAIAPAIDCGVALGLLEVRQSTEMVSNVKAPNLYRLTYVPEKGRRAPTDEWAHVTAEGASAAIARFQETQKKSRGQCPNVTAPSAPMSQRGRPPSAPMSHTPVPHGEHTFISGGKPPSAGAAGSIPSASEPVSTAGIPDDSHRLLKWMQGYRGLATHRTAQQHLSGVLKGDQIVAAAETLQAMALLTVQKVPNQNGGISRLYQLTDAGRDPALVGDDRQVDLERWVAEAVQ